MNNLYFRIQKGALKQKKVPFRGFRDRTRIARGKRIIKLDYISYHIQSVLEIRFFINENSILFQSASAD